MNQQLIDFYTMNGEDNCGRTLNEIMAFDDTQLEEVHDYIQWLLPTKTRSQKQIGSPTLCDSTIDYLKFHPTFSLKYQKSIKKMLDFWQIPHVESWGWCINILPIKGAKFWTHAGDHNQLRLARAIESTRLLFCEQTSSQLFHALVQYAGNYQSQHELTAKNLAYWYQAYSGHKILS